MKQLTALMICSLLPLYVLAACGGGSSSGSSGAETESVTGTETSGEDSSDLSGGDITGKWKLRTANIDSYEIFGTDGTVKEISDYSSFLSFSGGKVFVFGNEAEYSFDGKTLSITSEGKEVYRLGKLSGGTDDKDVSGSYKDIRGEDDPSQSGSYVTYYDIDGDKTFVSFGSNPYTVSGNKLTISYTSGDNTESAEFTYGIDGDILTITDGETRNTFEREN